MTAFVKLAGVITVLSAVGEEVVEVWAEAERMSVRKKRRNVVGHISGGCCSDSK
jgi:hypothetical protein